MRSKKGHARFANADMSSFVGGGGGGGGGRYTGRSTGH